MANIKFSQFTVGNTQSDIDFVVGYKGPDNIQISPTNLLASSLGNYLPLAGGTMTGDLTTNGDIIIDNSSGDPFLKLKTAVQEWVVRIDQSDSEKFQIRNITGTDTALSIDTSGNVGIGTTSPSAKLQVGDGTFDANARVLFSDSTYVEMRGYGIITNRSTSYYRPTADKTQTLSIGNDGNTWDYITHNANYHTFETDSNEWMRITNTGDVGIGTTTPAAELDVVGTIDTDNLTISGNQGTVGQVLTSTGTGVQWQTGGGGGSFVLNFSASHGSNSSGTYYMFRNKSNSSMVTFSSSATQAPDFYYSSLVMPVPCYLKTIHIKNIQTTPSATVANIKIWKNDTTAEFTGSNVSWTGAGAVGASWTQTLTSSDNSFAAGDRVDIGFLLDGTMGGVTCAMLFELL